MSVKRFLTERAVNIAVHGSYSLERLWYDPEGRLRTFACRTTRVSPFRMIVEAPVVGQIGERLTAYFSAFGQFEGTVSDTMQGSFLFKMEMTATDRTRLADKLAWIERKLEDSAVQDAREAARIIPPPSPSRLMLADGTAHNCSIIDISASGAALASDMQPPIGTPLAVGPCVGRVIRTFDTGFAVKFVEKQKPEVLSRFTIARTQVKSSTERARADRDQVRPSPDSGDREDISASAE